MAWTDLKATVAAVVKTNGTQAITGALLQSTLSSIIDQVGANSTFKGVAIPSTNPGTTDGPVFYLTSTPGVYPNFGGIIVNPRELAVLTSTNGIFTKVQIVPDFAAQTGFRTGALELVSNLVSKFDGAGGCGVNEIGLISDGDEIEFDLVPRTTAFTTGGYSFFGKQPNATGGISIHSTGLAVRDNSGAWIVDPSNPVVLNGITRTVVKLVKSGTNILIYVDNVLKRTVTSSNNITGKRIGDAYLSCYWRGEIYSITSKMSGITTVYSLVEDIPGFSNDGGTGAKLWSANESLLDEKSNSFLLGIRDGAIQMNTPNTSYINLQEEYDLSTVGDYIELFTANPLDGAGSSSNICMFSGTLTNAGYYAGKFYFRSNSSSGADYRIWDLPNGFDKSLFHHVKIVNTIYGWELIMDDISLDYKTISANPKVKALYNIREELPVEYDYGFLKIHSQITGEFESGAYGLSKLATGKCNLIPIPDGGYFGLITLIKNIKNIEASSNHNSQSLEILGNSLSSLFYSAYNTTEDLSRTILEYPITIDTEGDYIEIEARYTGGNSDYRDKLNLLGGTTPGLRFGWYNLTQFWVRRSDIYIIWDNITIPPSDFNLIKLVIVSGGVELFLNGISQGVKALPETGGFSISGICNGGDLPQKYDIKGFKISNSSGVFAIDLLAIYPGSENVKLDPIDSGGSESNPVSLLRFIKYSGGVSSSQRDMFEIALRDSAYPNLYYVFQIANTISVGMDIDPILYSNQWRIDSAYLGNYDSSSNTMGVLFSSIITVGESECVFHDVTTSVVDFTGGTHGDERIDIDSNSFVKFFKDGVEIQSGYTSESRDWAPCNNFSYLQRSTMHKTAERQFNYDTGLDASSGTGLLSINSVTHHFLIDGVDTGLVAWVSAGFRTDVSGLTTSVSVNTTWAISEVIILSNHQPIVEHWKHTIFDDQGYITKNRLKILSPINMFWYHGISCIGKQVSTKGYNENYLITDYTGSGGNPSGTTGTGLREYRAWNPTNLLSAFVTSKLTKGGDDSQCYMFIWDTTGYSKYYRRFPNSEGTYSGQIGDILESEMVVKLNTSN